jgi:hypothetical protein
LSSYVEGPVERRQDYVCAVELGMKTERKYPEPNRIVFCILSDRIHIFVSDFTVFAFHFVFQM